MGLGFGNFAGQLSADELARAYAAAGGRPDELEMLQPAKQPAPVPVPVAPPPDMGLRAPHSAPARAIQELDRAQLEDANARVALAGEAGEQKARSHEQAAGLRGEQAQRARETTESARDDVARRRQHEDKYQAEADRIYEEMKAHTQPPPQSTLSKVMGIVAMVASTQGKGGAAQGASMLAGMFGKDPGRWEAEQRANSNLYQNALSMIDRDRSGASHDLDVAQRITALEANEYEAALGQIAETSKSAEMRSAARDTQLQLRMQTRAGLRAMEEAKAKAAGAKQRGKAEAYFWEIPLDQLRQMPSQVLGETGQKVLAERTKQDQAYRKGEKEIEKEAAGAGQSADERKMQRLLTGVTPAVTNLRRQLESGGTLPHPWTENVPEILTSEETLNLRADMQAVADILLRDESGAAIGEDEAEKKKKGWGITSGDPEVRRRGLEKMLAEYDARLNSAGPRASGGGGAPAQTFRAGTRGLGGTAPAPIGSQPVTMVSPQGKSFQVHPSRVQQLRAQGWNEAGSTGEQAIMDAVRSHASRQDVDDALADMLVAQGGHR